MADVVGDRVARWRHGSTPPPPSFQLRNAPTQMNGFNVIDSWLNAESIGRWRRCRGNAIYPPPGKTEQLPSSQWNWIQSKTAIFRHPLSISAIFFSIKSINNHHSSLRQWWIDVDRRRRSATGMRRPWRRCRCRCRGNAAQLPLSARHHQITGTIPPI